MIVGFWNTTQHYRRVLLTTYSEADYDLVSCDHRLLVDAVTTRNVRGGEEVLRIHIERARQRYAARSSLFDSSS